MRINSIVFASEICSGVTSPSKSGSLLRSRQSFDLRFLLNSCLKIRFPSFLCLCHFQSVSLVRTPRVRPTSTCFCKQLRHGSWHGRIHSSTRNSTKLQVFPRELANHLLGVRQPHSSTEHCKFVGEKLKLETESNNFPLID